MTIVGDYLKKEREARHLSVQEVAELTKISARYLACIECGDYDQLPPGPYAKGYIAAYARQVCGDESQALELYSGSRADVQGPATDPVCGEETPFDEAAECPPLNGNGGSKWQAKVATGLSFARSLRKALPEKGNLQHLSNGGAKDKPALAARLETLLGPLSRATAALTRLPKDLLIKGGLTAGLLLVCAAVLVLAGFGVYHLFIFTGPSQSPPALQTQVTPAASDQNARIEETLTPGAPTAEFSPKTANVSAAAPKKISAGASTPSAKVPPHKTKKVRKPSNPEPPVVAKTESVSAPQPSPPAPEKAAAPSTGPLKDETPAATAAPQSAAPAPQPAATARTDAVAGTLDIPVGVIKASVCTAIEDRMPAGVSEVFPWTTQKIYVWSLLSAKKPPAKIRHIYYHAGRKVSDVTLTVGSSYWRTWSFHTLSGQLHIGPWQIDIATMDGRVMRRLHFEIQ